MLDSKVNPILSIVIPSWNRPRELIRLLESITKVDSPDLEVVICDDGSPAGAMEPVLHWMRGHQTVRFLRNERNLGLVGNWNQTLSQARGTWICFMCDDDWFLPGAIDRILTFVQAHPQPCVVLQDPSISQPILHRTPGFDATASLRLPIISGNFWHRSLTDHLGGFDERLIYSPDAEFWPRLVFHYPQVIFREPLAVYSLHNKNYALETWRKPDFLDQILLVLQVTYPYFHLEIDENRRRKDTFAAQRDTIDTILRETVGRRDREDIFRIYSQKALTVTHSEKEIREILSSYRIQRFRGFYQNLGYTLKNFIKRLIGWINP